MYTLYHYPIDPRSRKVRVALQEKQIPFTSKVEEFWKQDRDMRRLNPMLNVPFLTSTDGLRIVGSQNIIEYFEETFPEKVSLMTESPEERAEIRRLVFWVDDKMYHDITKIMLYERVFKFFESSAQANQRVLSFCRGQVPYHLQYFNFLLRSRQYLAGNEVTLADLAVASHLSTLDFFGEVKWELYKDLADWYAAIKSRQSFRPLLEDKLPGFKTPPHYSKLDF